MVLAVANGNGHPARLILQEHFGLLTVFHGILNKIPNGSAHGFRPARQNATGKLPTLYWHADFRELVAKTFQQSTEIVTPTRFRNRIAVTGVLRS